VIDQVETDPAFAADIGSQIGRWGAS